MKYLKLQDLPTIHHSSSDGSLHKNKLMIFSSLFFFFLIIDILFFDMKNMKVNSILCHSKGSPYCYFAEKKELFICHTILYHCQLQKGSPTLSTFFSVILLITTQMISNCRQVLSCSFLTRISLDPAVLYRMFFFFLVIIIQNVIHSRMKNYATQKHVELQHDF